MKHWESSQTISAKPVGVGLCLSDGFLRPNDLDAHRDDGNRFVARADEKLTAFLELERITHELAVSALLGDDPR